MKTTITFIVLFFAATCCFAAEAVYLGGVSPDEVSQGYETLQVDRAVSGAKLSIAGQTFQHGLGTHANSKIVYELEGKYERFEAKVGVDDAMKDYTKSSVVFIVLVDGEKKFDSGVMRINDAPKNVSVDLNNAETLELVVTDAGDGKDCDHANWADAKLVGDKNKISRNYADFKFDFMNNDDFIFFYGSIILKGCKTEDIMSDNVNINSKTGIKKIRIVKDKNGNKAKITEHVVANNDGGYSWQTEIVGLGEAWTTAIRRVIYYDNDQSKNTKIWTAWSNPNCGQDQQHHKVDHTWVDPFQPQPFLNAKLYYGSRPFNMSSHSTAESVPFHRNLFCIPMLSYLESSDKNGTIGKKTVDFGVSIVQNPSDKLLDMNLRLSPNGRNVWEYNHLRISKDTPILFRVDFVRHEADWRGGMRWIVKTYPEYFNPPNPQSDKIAGTASYSTNAVSAICDNAEKLHKMNYRVNWQASFDFPFFGMFIPPVADDVKWKSFG
ncbi:MAG: NPCBM/NEW2 domain-containing protein, partial [Planctomycetaceae bacterium]|nr:NPCBM/NEW2 domain-containing protein [Planctomycetaceae bacterium]